MTVDKIAQMLDGKTLVSSAAEIEKFYVGDFLSHVIAGAPSGCGWLTIMNNINVAGVAVMADVRLIMICEKVEPIPQLVEKCQEEGIALIASPLPVFDCAVRIAKNL